MVQDASTPGAPVEWLHRPSDRPLSTRTGPATPDLKRPEASPVIPLRGNVLWRGEGGLAKLPAALPSRGWPGLRNCPRVGANDVGQRPLVGAPQDERRMRPGRSCGGTTTVPPEWRRAPASLPGCGINAAVWRYVAGRLAEADRDAREPAPAVETSDGLLALRKRLRRRAAPPRQTAWYRKGRAEAQVQQPPPLSRELIPRTDRRGASRSSSSRGQS